MNIRITRFIPHCPPPGYAGMDHNGYASRFLVVTLALLVTSATLSLAGPPVAPFEIQHWSKTYVVNAWCRDFLLGSVSGDKPNKYGGRANELWVQMAGERGAHRIPAAIYSDGKTSTRDCSSFAGDGLVSPDAQWVALSQKHATHFAVAFILQRNDQGGFTPLPKLVSEMVWDKFLEEHPDLRKQTDGASLCDLVAWEPDGSRLWLSLRGGDRRSKGAYQWYCAWETGTRRIIVPPEVQLINRFAIARWTSGDGELSGERARAEEEHYRFLATLACRIEQPGAAPEPAALSKEWRQLCNDPGVADRARNNAGTSPAGIARQVIEEQFERTFRASLRLGAVAPGQQEIH